MGTGIELYQYPCTVDQNGYVPPQASSVVGWYRPGLLPGDLEAIGIWPRSLGQEDLVQTGETNKPIAHANQENGKTAARFDADDFIRTSNLLTWSNNNQGTIAAMIDMASPIGNSMYFAARNSFGWARGMTLYAPNTSSLGVLVLTDPNSQEQVNVAVTFPFLGYHVARFDGTRASGQRIASWVYPAVTPTTGGTGTQFSVGLEPNDIETADTVIAPYTSDLYEGIVWDVALTDEEIESDLIPYLKGEYALP